MSELVNFTYILPCDNEIEVSATVTPGLPELAPSLDHPGDPAEGPTIEIGECYLKDNAGNHPDLFFDPEDLYFKNRDGKFINVIDDIEEYAWEAYNDQ